MTREPFPALNFPVVPQLRWKTTGGKNMFWDKRRGKYLVMTPEEWVRQHVVAWLESEGYPPALIAVERALEVNGMRRRFDIVVFDRRNRPYLLVECKRPEVAPGAATFNQALAYNRALQAPYLMVTNGLQHYLVRWREDQSPEFLEKLPAFEPVR